MKQSRDKRTATLASLLILLVIAIMFIANGRSTASAKAQTSSVAPGAAQSATAALTTKPAVLALPGAIRPDEEVELFAKASGYISKISVDIGSKVKAGDVLVELDIPELRDELQQAEATLRAREAKRQSLEVRVRQAQLMIESAKAEQQRYKAEQDLANITLQRKAELYQGKAIPAQEMDVARNVSALAEAQIAIGNARIAAAQGDLASAEADVKAAQADVAVATAEVGRVKTLLGYTSLKAPFDGVVTRREVDHGAFVRSAAQGAGSPLLTIAKVDRVRLVVDVPESSAAQIHAGTIAEVQLRGLGDSAIKAAVSRTALSIQSQTRTMRTEIDLQNDAGQLLPGMYARVVLHSER